MKKLSFIFITLLAFIGNSYCQQGSLDTGFGNGGSVSNQFGLTSAIANTVAIQTDGKIVVAGAANGALAIARYESNGSIDFLFGSGGRATHNVSGSAFINSIKILPSGKILLGGKLDQKALVIRLDDKGLLDNSFGTNGVVAFGGPGSIQDVAGLDITSNGRIVGGGQGTNAAMSPKFCVFRLMPSGGTDANFGTAGVVQIDGGTAGATSKVHGFVQHSDGRLFICGETYSNSTDFDAIVAAFKANGTVDNTFGTNGKAITALSGNSKEIARDIAIQSDGKIVICGRRSSGSNNILLIRYNANGTLDNSFGSNGSTVTAVPTYTNNDARSIAFLSNGKFLVCSEGSGNSGNAFIVARYNSNGTLDNAFGTNGIAAHPVINRADANEIAIQPNGKVVVCGSGLNTSNLFVFTTARLNNSGTSGILNPSDIATVTVYPNPTRSTLNIKWAEAFKAAKYIEVYDQSQRLLINIEVTNSASNQDYVLPVGGISKGTYTLRIVGEQGNTLAVQQFVKN